MHTCIVCGSTDQSNFRIVSSGKLNNQCNDCVRTWHRNHRAKRKMNKLCIVCGKDVDADSDKATCKSCYEQGLAWRRIQQRSMKQRCVEYLGGRCVYCLIESTCYSIYDFDHRDPSYKSAGLSVLIRDNSNWDVIKQELDKCDLVCSNCHRIRHAISQVDDTDTFEQHILQYNQDLCNRERSAKPLGNYLKERMS